MGLRPWQEVGVLFVRGDAVTFGPLDALLSAGLE